MRTILDQLLFSTSHPAKLDTATTTALSALALVACITALSWGTAGVLLDGQVEPLPVVTRGALELLAQRWLPFSASLALLIIGAFYFSFWLARRAEREHLLLAAATVVWAIFNLQYVLPPASHALTAAWQQTATQWLPIPWLNALIYLFVAHLVPTDCRPRWLERLLPWYVGLYTVAVLPFWPLATHHPMLFLWAYTTIGIASVATIMTGMLRQQPAAERRVIQIACGYCILAALNDLLRRQGFLLSEGPHLVPYTGLAMLGSFTFALQRKYVVAFDAAESAQQNLQHQLSLREAELSAQHTRVLELERTQVQAQERQRLMRDLHDGVGGTLTTSLMLAEQGNLHQADMVEAMRQAVDDLRAMIDALDPSGQTLGELLANLRHRLHPRCQAAGIASRWLISPAAEACQLNPATNLHLLRWLQEALTNALRHAGADHITVDIDLAPAPVTGTWLRVLVHDDGQGFQLETNTPPAGRGLTHLQQRANALRAQFELITRPGAGTTLALQLPMTPAAA